MKDFFKHPIVAGTTTAFITLAITTPIVAYTKSISFIKSLKTIWEWIISLLTFGIPVWIILLVVFVAVTVLRIINTLAKNKPDFLDYKSDIVEGIKWEWEFYTYGGKYNFSSPTPVPICRNCDGYLVLDNSHYHILKLRCEHCSFEKQISEDNFSNYQEKIKREIFRRIRTNSWRK